MLRQTPAHQGSGVTVSVVKFAKKPLATQAESATIAKADSGSARALLRAAATTELSEDGLLVVVVVGDNP